ncbi:MAG: hypothetical protein DRI46_08375 [Chloroflexi bacterium]|nr:MAG: hypothetical protein DRI46_08375 [Chloroflexota bacterium]
MAISAERYIPDSGSVFVNGGEVNGSVKTVSPAAPRRAERTVNSLGGSVTDLQDQDKAGDLEVQIELFDDKSLAHDITGLLHILHNAYETNTPLTGLVVIPAGSTAGMAEYTYGGTIHVVQCPPHADLDADTEDEATVSVVITAESVSIADAT